MASGRSDRRRKGLGGRTLIRRTLIVTRRVAVASIYIAMLTATVVARQVQTAANDVRGLLDRGAYDQAETLAEAHLRSVANDPQAGPAAADLLLRTLVLNGKSTANSARALAEKTLQDKTASLGHSHVDLVPSLLNLSDVLVAAGDYALAVDTAQRAVTLMERQHGLVHALLAEPLDHLGSALEAAGRQDNALTVLHRSLKIKEALQSTNDIDQARTLELIGYTLQRKGEYLHAGTIIRRAVALREAVDDGHAEYAGTMSLLSLQLLLEGDLAQAREASARAVELAEQTLRPGHPTLARALRYSAGAVLDLGDLAEGRALFARAVQVAEQAYGQHHYQMWAYLNDLALTDWYMGSYTEAQALFERALQIAEAKVGSWHDQVATTVNNQARVLSHLGEYEPARRGHLRAIAIWERIFDRDHPFIARALIDLARIYRDQAQPREAVPLLERALSIRERRLGVEHRDVGVTLAEFAATLRELDQPGRAQALSQRALRIWEKAGAPEGLDFVSVPLIHAAVQRDSGQNAAAQLWLERAMAIQDKAVGRSHPLYATTQADLAATLAAAGDNQNALQHSIEAAASGRSHLRLMMRYLPERQGLTYAAARASVLSLVLSLSTASDAAPAPALDSVIRTRALITDEMAARRRVDFAIADGNKARLHAEFTSVQQRLANLLVRGPGPTPVKTYAAMVERTRREAEALEGQLAEQSASFRERLGTEHVGLEQIRAALPGRSALVSFVRYERSTALSASAPRPRGTVPAYMAFVLASDRPVAAIPLGTAASIEPLIARWRQNMVAEAAAGAVTRASAGSRQSGSALRKLIWDPLTTHLAGAEQILIVADGALHLVPFAALPVGTSAYVIEQAPPIHYLSTERDLVEQSRRADAPRENSGLLALGAPAFDGPAPSATRRSPSASATTVSPSRGIGGCVGLKDVRFHQLNGALQETRDIASLWHSQSGETLEESARILTGLDASEHAFKRDAPGRRILHLATHGFFLGPDCMPSTGTPRGIGGLVSSSGRKPSVTRRENPLHLSGLALAGANRRASAGPQDDDGVLTAEEVVTMDLGGVEWAVLSACETGLGTVHTGEGVFGLRRAFQVAGVRTIIMSLWSVDDQAARAWMRALYDGRLNQRLSTAQAVHAASLSLLQQRRTRGQSTHPFYWAAFVAVGDSK